MALKVTVVGGGSTYTPELIEGIVRRSHRLPVDELVLADIDHDRLDVVGGFARRMLDRAGWPGRLVTTDDLAAALDGANFVLLQLRVGGQQTRHVDETLPVKWGTIGQETTGAGGFAKALRTVPVVLDVAERARRLAAPDHWIIDFTNPVGIVTQALLDHGHRAIGLCNVAIGNQRRFAEILDVPYADVQLEHVGLNHLTWERAVWVDGVDRLPELLEHSAEAIGADLGLPADLIATMGAIPSYYLRFYYHFPTVLAEQRNGTGSRASAVADIERRLIEMYSDPAVCEKPSLLDERGGAYYSEAAAQLIASLHDGLGDAQVVNVHNAGALPDLGDTDVVEVPATIDREGAHPIGLAPLAPEIRGLVQHVRAYECLTVTAATTGSRTAALRALLTNPLVGSWDVAVPLLDEILTANADRLPAFA